MEKKKKKVGRKSYYHTKVEPYLELVKSYRQDGQTEENISKLLGVSYRAFNDYKNKFPQLKQALKESKQFLVSELKQTMFQTALGKGFTTKSKKVFIKDHRTGKMILDKEEVQTDQNKPSPSLLIFSLKNLDPENFADRREYVDMTGYDSNLQLVNQIISKVDINEKE